MFFSLPHGFGDESLMANMYTVEDADGYYCRTLLVNCFELFFELRHSIKNQGGDDYPLR